MLLETPLNDEQKEIATIINKSSTSLVALVGDILDFTQLQAKQVELDKAPFSLHGEIRSCIALMAQSAAVKNIGLGLHFGPSCPETISGDAVRFRQVLMNLLSNAIKFTDFGEIAVFVDVSNSADGRTTWLHIHVRDTGIGIPSDVCRHVFDPFIRADTSLTRRVGGVGIGLTISKCLIELMGGTITVDSTQGKGSTFSIHLPLPQASSPEATSSALSVPNPEQLDESSVFPNGDPTQFAAAYPLKILLAEDNPSNQKLVIHLLGKFGYSIDVVTNGLMAVESVKHHSYDVVLMDVQMPEMDGLSAARIIRNSLSEDKQPVIIALTAHIAESDHALCTKAGMDDFLTKPFRRVLLARALQRAWQKVKAPRL